MFPEFISNLISVASVLVPAIVIFLGFYLGNTFRSTAVVIFVAIMIIVVAVVAITWMVTNWHMDDWSSTVVGIGILWVAAGFAGTQVP